MLKAEALIRSIPDFPTEGILFRDITPVLHNPEAFSEVLDAMTDHATRQGANLIVGIESRGFLFGAPMADRLRLPYAPVRKLGKLPGPTVQAEYALEYGTNTLEIHRDAIREGDRVLIVDDLLATGGTASAAAELVEELGGVVAGLTFLIELRALNGRETLEGYDVLALIAY